ncbi:MAG: protein-S-isoprenylcysteine O-methyltransferase [Synoicihabitans sp.]
MTPLSDYLPIACTLVLYVLRVFELRARKSNIPGKIHASGTFKSMVAVGSLAVWGGVAEHFVLERGLNLWVFIPGLLCGISAFALRGWAAIHLGKMWSVHVEIREKHELVETGPFHYVRHPIYTAAFLEIIGAVLVLDARWVAIPAIVAFIPIIRWRIRAEETAMVAQFGNDYRSYMKRTPSLIPSPFSGK